MSHHLLAPALAAGPPSRTARPPLAAIGLLYDEVWCCNLIAVDSAIRSGGGGGGCVVVPAHTRAMCAYLLGLVGRWRSAIVAECSDGVDSGAGTTAAAAAASATLSDTCALRCLLAGRGEGGVAGGGGSGDGGDDGDSGGSRDPYTSSGPAAACAQLCAPPWCGVLGSLAVATQLAAVTSGDSAAAAAAAAAATSGVSGSGGRDRCGSSSSGGGGVGSGMNAVSAQTPAAAQVRSRS